MSNITTTVITIRLTHSRPLTEEQTKNLVTNVAEHVRAECRADLASDGALGWGFAPVDRFEVSGVHTSGTYAEDTVVRSHRVSEPPRLRAVEPIA
jgi:hypothetical protein